VSPVALAAPGARDHEQRACYDATVFELTTLVGYSATLALQLRVFRVGVAG
jgi:hypothetical protein